MPLESCTTLSWSSQPSKKIIINCETGDVGSSAYSYNLLRDIVKLIKVRTFQRKNKLCFLLSFNNTFNTSVQKCNTFQQVLSNLLILRLFLAKTQTLCICGNKACEVKSATLLSIITFNRLATITEMRTASI